MKKTIFVLLGILAFQFAQAQDEDKVSVPANPMMESIRLANQLASYGYNNYSATALIEAAKILMSVPTQELIADSTQLSSSSENTKSSGRPDITVDRLLADAALWAGEDKHITDYLEDVKKEYSSISSGPSRGATGGPQSAISSVSAKDTDVWTVTFRGGSRAMVVVNGDGDTDLDLYVYDENGNLMGKDIDYSDYCVVSWTPRWTGPFTVKIINRGNVYNRYRIYTN